MTGNEAAAAARLLDELPREALRDLVDELLAEAGYGPDAIAAIARRAARRSQKNIPVEPFNS